MNPQFSRGFILPSPFILMGGVALAFGISTILFFNLWRASANELSSYIAKVEAANAQVAAENEALLAKARRDAAEIGDAHAAAMGVLARGYNSRLAGLQRSCDRATSRTFTPTAFGTHGLTADHRLIAGGSVAGEVAATAFEEAARQLEADSVDTTVKLIYLQDYVERVCK